jgi:hypothetical protein
MLRVIGSLGETQLRSEGSDDAILDRVQTVFEERADVTLRTLYTYVADRISGEFAELRNKASAQVSVLAKLAEVDDLTVPAVVDAEIRKMAGRVAWRPMARAAALGLFETAKSLARPVSEAKPISAATWATSCLKELDHDEFAEDTGLEGPEIDLVVHQTARAILRWPDLDAAMPMFFRGAFLTVGATADGVVLSHGAPLMLVAGPMAGDVENPISDIFTQFQPEVGVAAFASSPQFEVAVVAATEEGWFTEARDDDTSIHLYKLGKNMVQLGLPLVRKRTKTTPVTRVGAMGQRRASAQFDFDGAVVWDPGVVSVQAVGPAVLFKPKIGDHGFLSKGAEGLFRSVEVAKKRSFDFKSTTLFIDK